MTDAQRAAARMKMLEMMSEIATLDVEESDEFVKAMLLMGACMLDGDTHGVLLVLDKDGTMKVMGLNSTAEDAGFITAEAASVFAESLEARDLHRKGETH